MDHKLSQAEARTGQPLIPGPAYCRAARCALGRTAKELATRTQLSVDVLHSFEQDLAYPHADDLRRLASVLPGESHTFRYKDRAPEAFSTGDQFLADFYSRFGDLHVLKKIKQHGLKVDPAVLPYVEVVAMPARGMAR